MENRKIEQDKFKFIQKDEKIYDQKIEGKPVSSMKDVMIRFAKNKTNVVATFILLFIVLCSMFMPALTGKEYVKLNEKLAFLPPRIPVIEKLGVMDGTVLVENKPIDPSTYDEQTGLYLPTGYNPKAVEMDTLKNDVVMSTEKSAIVTGGQSVMRLDYDSTEMTVESKDYLVFTKASNPKLAINLYELTGDAAVEVLLQTKPGTYEVIATLNEAGLHELELYKLKPEIFGDIFSKLRLRMTGGGLSSAAMIESVKVIESSSEAPVFENSGYALSLYPIVDGAGSYVRQNGEMIVATFRYNRYIAAFDLTHEIAFSSEEYDKLVAQWGVEPIPNPDNPDGWFFEEGFPIREVVKKNDVIVIDDKEYFSYEVYLDYQAYLGYEELPYFWFGTSAAGRDLFSLIWVGLRTSLLMGVVTTIINVIVGVIYGAIAGYYGGTADLLMQRFAELMGRLPWLVVLSILVVLMDPGITTLFLILIINGWVGFQSVTRMQFYRYKGREYVLASRTMGAKDRRLIFRHILPNGIGTIITASVLSIPSVIFLEASLSYLGYGIGHGQSFNILGMHFTGVSIGVLLSDARAFLQMYPYLTIFPSVIISILMITFNMFGNALRDAFNPSLRGVE
ncbi:ABC transporter permease [Candidatus Epulonipiscium viviparus]|uniref:ABC transporter permease n=1 Tax=Candidatus Epulonipiscium viviparus TaxID=420336 RepID=UPI0027380F58|nr:ABC transporter permease [Candidatus Epulopiscium viviparus]